MWIMRSLTSLYYYTWMTCLFSPKNELESDRGKNQLKSTFQTKDSDKFNKRILEMDAKRNAKNKMICFNQIKYIHKFDKFNIAESKEVCILFPIMFILGLRSTQLQFKE